MDLAEGALPPGRRALGRPRGEPAARRRPAGLAPAYVVTAGFDPLRDEGEAYAAGSRTPAPRSSCGRFPDQIHGFFNIVGAGRTARAATAEVAARLGAGLGVGQ